MVLEMFFMSDKDTDLFRNRETIHVYDTYDTFSMLQIKLFTVAMFKSHFTLIRSVDT